MSKVVTDDLLKQVTTDIITSLAEHMVEYEAYSEDEILELFNLTPEEAQQLSELIRDDIVSQYKLWSSNKVNNEITLTKTECNDYTDKMVAGLSNVKLLFANSLPSVGDDNTIYIHPQLQDDGSVIYTLNIWSTEDSDWVTFGNLNIDFSQYYKKDEVDELLALKADKTEILSQDDVIADTTLATTSNVLSATTTLNELDKKIDKDKILLTYSANVTDEQVFSAKVIHGEFKKGFNGIAKIGSAIIDNNMNNMTEEGITEYVLDTTNILNFPPVKQGITRFRTKIEILATNFYKQEIEFQAGVINQGIWYRNYIDNNWSPWQKINTSTIEDVQSKYANISLPNTLTLGERGFNVKYLVMNGVCEMFIYAHLDGNSFTGRSTIASGVPAPMLGEAGVDIMCTNGSLPYMKVSVSGNELQILVASAFNTDSGYWTGTFRYQVAKS